jgi:hypothetical protein
MLIFNCLYLTKRNSKRYTFQKIIKKCSYNSLIFSNTHVIRIRLRQIHKSQYLFINRDQ